MSAELDRSSPLSVAASAVAVARERRETIEAELEQVPGWRVRRRAQLDKELAEARAHEKRLLRSLGGKSAS